MTFSDRISQTMLTAFKPQEKEGWGYPILLAFLFAIFLVQPWAGRSVAGAVLAELFYRGIIVGALIVVCSRRWLVASGLVVVALGVVLGLLTDGSGSLFPALENACSLVVLLVVIGAFLADVLRHPRVTVGTISGSICVFMLIGIAWMLMFSIADQTMVDAFDGLSPRGSRERPGELFYFSFVTLTTLGYGDISPSRPETMSLAALEAVVGQLYLIVMVAAFVGRRGEQATSNIK